MELVHGSCKVPKFAPEGSSMLDEAITNILDRLPLQDAVKTSILSSCWESKWTMLNQLVFDEKFFRFLKERKHEKDYVTIIYGILLRHTGTITKFVLYMPFDSIDVNNWVEYLSRKGIKEFTMNETPLELPRHGSRKVPDFAPEDVIRKMPDEVITHILDRLPLQDAVRTSILSSCWESKRTMLNQLVFDEKFFRFLEERAHEEDYVRIIYGILLRHTGTITKFVLYIDSIVDFQDVNNWVEYLSRKGIKEFTLKNMNKTPLELPRHLFSCRELKHLKLYNCYFCPKSSFQGFPSLLCLDLSEVVFEGYTCGELISRCPSLEILKLRSNTRGKINRVDLAKLGNLKVLILQLRELVNKETIITSSDIFQIIGLFPKLQELNLNFWKRKLSADAEKSILTALPYVKTLRLYEIDLSNEIMLSCVIDLLKNCSNLESLLIKAAHKDDDPALAVSSSKAYFCKLGQLHLRKVKFALISCTENEVCLMKSLLAFSRSLKKMVIIPKSSEMFGSNDGERKFITELKQHRASPGTKIVFESSDDATTSLD